MQQIFERRKDPRGLPWSFIECNEESRTNGIRPSIIVHWEYSVTIMFQDEIFIFKIFLTEYWPSATSISIACLEVATLSIDLPLEVKVSVLESHYSTWSAWMKGKLNEMKPQIFSNNNCLFKAINQLTHAQNPGMTRQERQPL